MTYLLPALSAIASFVEERAYQVLPSVPTDQTFPYVMAVFQHLQHGTEDTFAQLLALMVREERLDADQASKATLWRERLEHETLADGVDRSAPTSRGRHLVGTDGTIKTHRRGVAVIGHAVHAPIDPGHKGNATYRMMAHDAFHAANYVMRSAGQYVRRLGTDDQAWPQVVEFRPETSLGLILAPQTHGVIVGSKLARRTINLPRPRYGAGTVCMQPLALVMGAEVIQHVLQTTYAGRAVFGHGHWQTIAGKAHKPRTTRATTRALEPIAERDQVAKLIEHRASTLHKRQRYAIRTPQGDRFVVTMRPDQRYRVSVTLAGVKIRETTVSAPAYVAAVVRNALH